MSALHRNALLSDEAACLACGRRVDLPADYCEGHSHLSIAAASPEALIPPTSGMPPAMPANEPVEAGRLPTGRDLCTVMRSRFAPAQTRLSERADAARTLLGKLWHATPDEARKLRAEYEVELDAIDARYLHSEAMKAEVRL